jgi:hypothetical protein
LAESMSGDTLESDKIRFVDNFVPSLAAGDYTIETQQTLKGTGNFNASSIFTAAQEFTVSGPRFSLALSDIYTMYPPPNSQGLFKYDLPHIVLSKRALPWERSLFKDNQTPWMALLLFDASEILPPEVVANERTAAHNASGVTTISVQELVNPQTSKSTTFCAYKNSKLTASELEQTCQVFDITPETFKALMPSLEDIKDLVHCREVIPAQSGAAAAEKWYAVVVGARFPGLPEVGQAARLNVVHLVSLEGFEDYLNDPGHPKILEGKERIRLVSLASWSFTCLQAGGGDYRGLMLGLVANQDKSALEFRLPMKKPDAGAAPEEKFAYNVVYAGYIPCGYQTRGGERTFAWYRGPFTPRPVLRFPPDRPPFKNSTQVMVYDQEHGLFDLSYATAWETGRLLALSDQRFGAALLNWRRTAHRVIDQRMESSAASADPAAASNSTTYKKSAEEAFMTDLLRHFAASIEQSLFKQGSQPPAEPAGPTTEASQPGKSFVDLYQDEGVQQELMQAASDELNTICEWLAQLYLLNGVPFNNLVPDEGLLPAESIRYFYLDRNWLEVMLDGALSIGVQSSRDVWHWEALHGFLLDKLYDWIPAMKNHAGTLAGLLLRSSVVSGWPGLEVRAYAASNGESGSGKVELLRMDRLSENVLLCIFNQVPAWIEFNEPREGLHFGVQKGSDKEFINLRGLDGTPSILTADTKCDENRKLNIPVLKADIKTKLGLDINLVLSPADFALQMVKAPEKMVFQNRLGS